MPARGTDHVHLFDPQGRAVGIDPQVEGDSTSFEVVVAEEAVSLLPSMFRRRLSGEVGKFSIAFFRR